MQQIAPILQYNITILAKSYAKARGGIKLTTVSKRIRGDAHFLEDYIAGRIGITTRKADDILQWFEDHWPDGAGKPTLKEFPKMNGEK